MSKDKPNATATIRFYPGKHITVNLDSISGVTPRAINIAHNLLNRKFRAMRGKHNADAHAEARKQREEEEKARVKSDKEYHEKRDEELASASKTAEQRHADFIKTQEKELTAVPEDENTSAPEDPLPEPTIEAAEVDDTPIEEVTEDK